jgi:hypothetical protein
VLGIDAASLHAVEKAPAFRTDGRLLAVGIYEKPGPTPVANASQSVKGLTDGNGTMWFLVDDDGSINSAYQDIDTCCCNILYWLKTIHGLEFELIDYNDEGEQGSDSDDIAAIDDGRDDRDEDGGSEGRRPDDGDKTLH